MMYLLTNCVFSTVKINYRRVNTFLIILVVWWNINGILICILSTFLILFVGLWIVADMTTHWYLKRFERDETVGAWSTIQRQWVYLVVLRNILGWFCQAPLPYPRTDPESVAIRLLATATVAGLFAHRWPGVGRMLGCSPNISCAGDRFGT